MALDVIALALGLLILGKAADTFVTGAARLSLALRISPVLVGAIVMGFGTSAPELLVSVLAAARGSLELAVGNIVGSNIANLTLVAGLAAIAAPLAVRSTTLRREAPIATASLVVLAVLVQGGLSRAEGAILVVLLIVTVLVLLRVTPREDVVLADEVGERAAPDEEHSRAFEAGRTALGLAGVLIAAQLIVFGAQGIAESAGLSEAFVGLTIVAVGTSLPEIASSVQAARAGQADLAVGNLFGSNMFNSLAVAGSVGLVGPGALNDPALTTLAVGGMIAAGVAAWALMGTGHCMRRGEGIALLVAYALLVALL